MENELPLEAQNIEDIVQALWKHREQLVLTCYLQGITQLDPIVWNLPHWRHLSATRPELPKLYWAV